MRKEKSIAIIGGGVCGLYLAWKLKEKGNKVIVYEKKPKIGNKVCSGLFSERILDFVPQSKNLIEREIDSVLIHFPKKTIKVNFSKKFYLMSHYQLDNLIADLFKKIGGKIILNSEIKKIPEEYDKVTGCDGAYSLVRKELKLKNPKLKLGILGFENKKRDSLVETWPVENGFVWKIPHIDKTEYGIISDPKISLKIFQSFLKNNKIVLEEIKSKTIPQGLTLPSNRSITLCGDAAGLTKPWSGGGVIWGLTAADILLKHFPDFLKYKKEAEKFFKPKIKKGKLALKTAYFLGFKLPWLIPQSVKIESDFL